MTSSASAMAERRSVPFLALVSIGILLASLMLGLRPQTTAPAAPQAPNVSAAARRRVHPRPVGQHGHDRLGRQHPPRRSPRATSTSSTALTANGGVGDRLACTRSALDLRTVATPAATPHCAAGPPARPNADEHRRHASARNLTRERQHAARGRHDRRAGEHARSDRSDEVDGVPVTQVLILLSDGRPWPDRARRDVTSDPSPNDHGNYLGAPTRRSRSSPSALTPQQPLNRAYILDPVLHGQLWRDPDSQRQLLPRPGRGDLLTIFAGHRQQACSAVTSRSTRTPTRLGPVEAGTEVTYTYRVTNMARAAPVQRGLDR